MIFLNKGKGVISSADPKAATADTLHCDKQRNHSVRMIFQTIAGVRTGAMVAWCYDCRRVVPTGPVAVVITDADRAQVRSRAKDTPVTETADTRKRNAAIRLEWARKRTPKGELAKRYGISLQRVIHIIHGKLPRGLRKSA